MKTDNINVVYDSMTAREKSQDQYGNWHEMTKNHLNLGSKIIKFNPDTGEFVHYYYVNRDRSNTPRSTFYYSPDQNIENMNIQSYKLDGNANLDELMPLSFGVNEDDPRLPKPVQIGSRSYLSAGEEVSIGFDNGLNSNSSYILKVTGRVSGKDKSSYVANGMLQMIDYPGRYVTRWDKQYFFKNDATAKANLEIQAVNPENKIIFKKVDQDGNALAGAKFELQYKQDGNWLVDTSRNKTTGDDGVFEYTKLKPGSYKVMEISAPTGYKKAEDPVAVFDVDENGRIIRKENIIKPVSGTSEDASNNEEEHGITPIEIVNKKEQKISFVKVDASDKKPLEGAEFKVFYKKEKTGEYSDTELKLYQNTNGDKLVLSKDETKPTGYSEVDKFTTGNDGKIEFTFHENGYYALKEDKAPSGYIKPRDYVKEFVVKDGKVQEEKYLTSMNVNKTKSWFYANGMHDVYNTDITMRFNPDHEKITYEQGKSKITLSGLPLNNEYYENNISTRTGITINARLVNTSGRSSAKSYTVPLSQYGTDSKGKITIDLYELVKELESKTADSFESENTIELSMSPTLALSTVLDINSKIEIGDGEDKIKEDRTFHIGTKGNEKVDHSYKFTTSEEISKDSTTNAYNPINIENKKGVYPLTGAMGIIGFLVVGAVMMATAYYKYRRKRRESALS